MMKETDEQEDAIFIPKTPWECCAPGSSTSAELGQVDLVKALMYPLTHLPRPLKIGCCHTDAATGVHVRWTPSYILPTSAPSSTGLVLRSWSEVSTGIGPSLVCAFGSCSH